MRNVFQAFILAVVLLAFTTSGFAAVGIQVDGVNQGGTEHINFVKGGSAAEQDGRAFNVPIVANNLVASGTANGGATSMTTTDLAVPVSYAYVRKAIADDVAFSAGTLADGVPGQRLTIHIVSRAGSGTFTVTPSRKTGITSITFDAVGEIATFLYVDNTLGWVLDGSTNATINIP